MVVGFSVCSKSGEVRHSFFLQRISVSIQRLCSKQMHNTSTMAVDVQYSGHPEVLNWHKVARKFDDQSTSISCWIRIVLFILFGFSWLSRASKGNNKLNNNKRPTQIFPPTASQLVQLFLHRLPVCPCAASMGKDHILIVKIMQQTNSQTYAPK